VVILEGVYSARPELADLLDLRVLCDIPAEIRRQWIVEREGGDDRNEWNRRWEEAEQWYFGRVMPRDRFDLVIPAA
jgi:uridine kinase